MPLHKVILGGYEYLGFALGKLRSLVEQAARCGGYASQKFELPDTSIRLHVCGEQQFLRMEGGGASYEFFTSERIHGNTLDTRDSPTGDVVVSGSATKWKKPIVSSVLQSPDTPPRWVYSTSLPVRVPDNTEHAWQNQKFDEYVWWPGNSSKSIVTSVQAQWGGGNSQCGWADPNRRSSIGNASAYINDNRYDVKPSLITASGHTTKAPVFTEPEAVWRRAAVQGNFFILTDNFGRFFVYRTAIETVDLGHAQAGPFQVPTGKYKIYTPPYPAWVTVPTPNPVATTTRYNQWLWAFNKDATKVVSCPFHSEFSSEMYIAPSPSGSAGIANAVIHISDIGMIGGTGYAWQGRRDTPGLVEFGVEIVETGTGDLDFDVVFTLLRSSYALTDQRWIVDAAYSLKDRSPTKTAMGCDEDTLITAEIEVYAPPGMYEATATNPPVPDPSGRPAYSDCYKDVIRGGVAKMLLRTNDSVLTPTTRATIPLNFESESAVLKDSAYPWFWGTALWVLTSGMPKAAINISPIPQFRANQRFSFPHNYKQIQDFPAPVGVEGSVYAYVYSLELRTLSYFIHKYDSVNGTSSADLYVYNTLEKTTPTPYAWTGTTPVIDRVAAATEKVPATATSIYDDAKNFAFWGSPGNAFCIHPDGHWSFYSRRATSAVTPELTVDIVKIKGRPATTHEALYNTAFGDTRTHAYYYVPQPEGTYNPNSQAWYDYLNGVHGGFKTSGIWITF